MSSPSKPFLFLHIPKTGGITFHSILCNQYRFCKRFSFTRKNDSATWSNLSDPEKLKYQVVKGHFWFGGRSFYPSEDVTYFTFLRNPKDRIISLYYHILRNPNHEHHKKVTENKYTIKDLYRFQMIINMDNSFVRFLSGNRFKKWDTIDEADLKLALHNFDTYFEQFGLLEKYDESLLILTYELGWKTPFYIRLNEGKNRKPEETLDEETLVLIKHFTRYDEILWEHAKKRFEAKLLKYKDRIGPDLEKFRINNKKNIFFRTLMHKLRGKNAWR